MRTSASQLDTYNQCPRKWWFGKGPLKLPSPKKAAQAIGTVTHSVAERWLEADRLGRTPDGSAVELYPPGWETAIDRYSGKPDGSATPSEQLMIKSWIEDAVAGGILVRTDEGTVEHEFNRDVIPGVTITGFIDHLKPTGVDDHKTAKNSRYLKRDGPRDATSGALIPIDSAYVKGDGTSPNCVGHEGQMLVYAYEFLQLHPETQTVLVAHNQFVKDPNEARKVRRVEALITRRRIEEHWALVQQRSALMLELKTQEVWQDVPGPDSPNACSAYGGCPFQLICGRVESTGTYLLKHQPKPATAAPSETTRTTMEIFNATGPGQAQPAAVAPAPVAFAPAPVADGINAGVAAPVAALPAVPQAPPAPWANADCRSCNAGAQPGVHESGRPCAVCAATAGQRGLAGPDSYDLQVVSAGVLAITPKAQQAAPAAPTQVVPPAPVQQQPAPVPQATPAAVPAAVAPAVPAPAAPVTAAPVTPEAAPADAGKARKAGSGRAKAGMTILVGCHRAKGPNQKTRTLDDIMAEYGEQLATKLGKASYYEIGNFDRQQMLAQATPSIVLELGTITIEATPRCQDTRAFLSALLPHASTVIQGAF